MLQKVNAARPANAANAENIDMSKDQVVYGIHAVQSALQHHPENVLGLQVYSQRRDKRLEEILALARKAGIAVENVSKQTLEKQAGGGRHQGVIARVRISHKTVDLGELLESLTGPALLLVLDGVQDPHNLGACLRTADAVGVDAVIVPKDKSASLTAVARKAACGAAETVSYIEVTNLSRALEQLQQAGIWITGADGEAESSLYDMDFTGPTAIVLGAEGKGLRRLTREHCDYLAHIPMRGNVESLNVSVATAVCLFEALRQRGNK
jgi:23S rRNA (guanosine2251-2'-O)-methyltransferase